MYFNCFIFRIKLLYKQSFFFLKSYFYHYFHTSVTIQHTDLQCLQFNFLNKL